MIKELFEWYLKHQSQLLKEYEGKVLVIKGDSVAGVYDSEQEAVFAAQESYSQGEYIIQKCSKGDSDYSHSFTSRVAFS